MKRLDAALITPIFVKTSPADDDWPDEPTFYVLASNGVFLCRNGQFFQSATRAQRPLSELAPLQPFLRIDFPLIPQTLLEQAVGFFDWAYCQRGAESVLLLGWNERRQAVELIAPRQIATSYRNARGHVFAESVRYDFPHPLAEGLVLFGDIHCHCDMAAYASAQDETDEMLLSGLHIVVGRLYQEPPQWHIDAVVDGVRSQVDAEAVLEGYRARDANFPRSWCDCHAVQYTGYQPPPAVTATGTNSPIANRSTPAPGSAPGTGNGKTTWGGKPLPSGSYSPSPAAGESAPANSDADSEAQSPRSHIPMTTTPETNRPGRVSLVPQLADGQSLKLIGLGGVGGILARYACLFLASLGRNIRVLLIDGDAFDPATNASRMYFGTAGNKAAVLRDELLVSFSGSRLTLSAIEEYVTPDNIGQLIQSGDLVAMCVDNHQTRSLVDGHCATLDNITVVSGGNDGVGPDSWGVERLGTFGNVQIYIRRDGRDLGPSLSQFHPEIAQPKDKRPDELSCTEMLASTPQILAVNLQTAAAMLSTLYLHLCGGPHYSELAFDIADARMGPLPLPAPAMAVAHEPVA